MSYYEPPKKVIQYWCDECGLKQWRGERIRHRVNGEACTGNVVKAEYMLVHTASVRNQAKELK